MEALEHLSKINDVCLFVDDFETAERFYTEKFGFRVVRRQSEPHLPNYLVFDFMGTAIALWEKSGVLKVLDEKHLGGTGHRFMIAVRVDTPALVDEIHRELAARGAPCIKPPQTYPFKCRAAYFTDPENNIWEVFSYMEGAQDAGLLPENGQ